MLRNQRTLIALLTPLVMTMAPSVLCADTITATQVSAAATNPGGPDLGDTAIAIVDSMTNSVEFAATGDNLGFEAGDGGFTPDTLGVAGGQTGRVASGELLTINFNSVATVTQVVLGRQGSNDIEATITGFSGDPGATLTPLDPAETDDFPLSFDAGTGTLTITSQNNGFIASYMLDFANTVTATALSIGSPTTNGGSGGIGFASVTFTPGDPIILGDVDGDGVAEPAIDVNNLGDDLGPIVSNFFTDGAARTDGDLTGDGFVGFADFRQWKDAVNSPLTAAQLFGVVPEPTSGLLLVSALLIGSSLRRTRTNG